MILPEEKNTQTNYAAKSKEGNNNTVIPPFVCVCVFFSRLVLVLRPSRSLLAEKELTHKYVPESQLTPTPSHSSSMDSALEMTIYLQFIFQNICCCSNNTLSNVLNEIAVLWMRVYCQIKMQIASINK